MGLSIKGYVLEPPRVGSANSPFTSTPNVYISNPGAFNTAYPSDESAPRTEYHVFVLKDSILPGTGPNGRRSFVDTSFCWTKNEVIQRFDYEGRIGRFKTLPGAAPIEAGILALDSNTNRIQVAPPLSSNLASYPVRVSVGIGSGTTFSAATVLLDVNFTTPSVGAVQISQETGHLNWNPADLTTYVGQTVRFQKQSFYSFDDSEGALGLIAGVLLLNPLPAAGQFPLIRIGFGEYLTPVQKANEASFSVNPTAGTVEWAVTTGRLKFNTSDVSNNAGRTVYYDGVACAFGVGIQTVTMGTIGTPGLAPVPEASDLFFRIPNFVQFPQTQYVDTLSAPGKKGTVQVRRSDGQVLFSTADQGLYPGQTVQAVIPEIDIERGITLRMFRTPVNLDDSSAVKDVSAFYVSVGATLADPIIGSPTIVLPAIPVDTQPIVVEVSQGTGSFTGVLPRMDVPSPPTGLGYVIDFETEELRYVQRKAGVVIPAPTPYGGVQLPDPLVLNSNLLLEVETAPGSGTYTALTVGEDALVDLESGLVTLVSTSGTLETNGSSASFAGNVFTDTTKNFTTAGILPGDFLVVLTGASKGIYTIATVGSTTLTTDVPGTTSSNLTYEIKRGAEILADRFFYEVPPVDPNTSVERIRALGTISNSPRLTVDPTAISRFRFGKTTFSTATVYVANDGAFTSPSSLPSGTVQIALDTGHVNFSQANVTTGGTVYWSRTLTLGIDYSLQPPLGFVQFTERMLELEEAFVTYKNSDGDLVQERVTFLVRKELVQAHPTPTDTLFFNPLGREVADVPTPRAFRGGRPQSGSQVQFDAGDSSVMFIGAPTLTNALPSGPIVDPSENVYVDYNIYEAIGGEQSFTVQQPPMQGVSIVINEGSPTFQIAGDRTTVFAQDILLLVDRTETYLIGSSSYDSGNQVTTVTLASPQTFRSDFNNPSLAVSSGKVRVSGTPVVPSYFVTELGTYDPIPRGGSKMFLQGDVSRTYVSGTVVIFNTLDLNLVSGSSYNKDTGKTEITLLANGLTQYAGAPLKRSVRPVLASPTGSVTTSRSPELGQPFLVFRRVEGSRGVILDQPEDYTIDASGVVALVDPLTLNEAFGIFYTGDTVIEIGRRFRATYTFGVIPTETNGLLNQILKIDYTTYIPDTFFWRVETFTNFRGELVESYAEDANSSVPTAGPILENSSSPRLFEQGKESVFFQEGYLANEDLVARPTLKYYNDAINFLEDALQGLDGRVVGDHDGRFLFDGNIDNPARATFAAVTNQIDDRFKISPAPYTVVGPPFIATSVGTFREVYKAAPTSRFYPTRRARFGVTVAGVDTGDPIMDIGVQNLRSGSGIQRRFPWAVTTVLAVAGATLITVDDADGSDVLIRPQFLNGMKVAIIAQDGTVLVADVASLTVASVSATSIGLTAPLPVNIPVGSTVRLATNDTTYIKYYRLGVDLGIDLEEGQLTYIEPAGSLLAWAGLTQVPNPPAAGEALDITVSLNNTLTAPDRFPALDGGTTDDDGNRQFPILDPSAISETSGSGYLTTERSLIQLGTGRLSNATTPSYVSVGNLDVTGTIITKSSGVFSPPLPRVHDLIRIQTGPNAPSTFHRITAVGINSVTVATPFPFPSVMGFTFTITANVSLVTGTAGSGSSLSSISDLSADYLTAGVLLGHTVVITSGSNLGLRRQITAVTSSTAIQFDAFPGTVLGATYRIDNPLATFGGVPDSLYMELLDALSGELGVLTSNVSPLNEVDAIDEFFESAFYDITTGSNGVTMISSLTSVGQTFITDGVSTSHLLYIRLGDAAGVYKIIQVLDQTTLLIDGVFGANTTGVAFRIVSHLGLTVGPLNDVLLVAQQAEAFETETLAFYVNAINLVSVEGDLGAFATTITDLSTRETQVDSRFTQVGSSITGIESELSAGDRLYDKRYVWIDARINLEKGILVMKDRAIQNRIKAQADVLKQLTKLLSVQQA